MSFGLIRASDFQPLAEADYQRYVRLEAISFSYKPDSAGLALDYEQIPTHTCNESDKFHQPNKFREHAFYSTKKVFQCFDHPENIEVYGNFEMTSAKILQIRAMKCQGDFCASDQDIDQFIEQHPYLVVFTNQRSYKPQVYSDQVILKEVEPVFSPLTVSDAQLNRYYIER